MNEFQPDQQLPVQQETKRYVDRSALVTSLVVLAVVSGAAYLWYRYSLDRNAKAIYEYAEHCAKNDDNAAAAEQFDHYVKLQPNDATARRRYAETYDLAYTKSGRVQRSIDLYRQALGVAPEGMKTPIRTRLAELLLESRQCVPAAEAVEELLKTDPKNVKAANIKAMALYGEARQGSFKGAPSDVGASFESALQQDPGNSETATTLARIYRDEPQYLGEETPATSPVEPKQKADPVEVRRQKADQIIDNLVAAHPEQPEVHLARYQYRLQYKIAGADDDLKEAQRLGPENIEILLAATGALLREAADLTATAGNASSATQAKVRSLRESARDKFQKMVTIAPDDYRGYLGLGDRQWELGQSQEAIAAWKLGLRSVPGAATRFDIRLASSLVTTGRFDEAEQPLDRLGKAVEASAATGQGDPGGDLFARNYQLLRAQWLRGKSQRVEAIALAHTVATGASVTSEEKIAAIQGWLFLADANASIGRGPEAAHAYDEVVKLAPMTPVYRAIAAASWMKAGRPDLAVAHLQIALAGNDNPQLRLALAEAIFRQNARVPKESRDWPSVQAALIDVRGAAAKQPLQETWRLRFLEAEFAKARADDEGRQDDGVREAASIYRNIKLDEKAEGTVLPVIAMAFERLGLRDDAERTISRWEKIVTRQQGRMFRSQVAASRKNYDEARRLAEIDLDKLSTAEKSSVQRFLVRLSLAEADWHKARAALDAVTNFGPGDLDLLFEYAELAGAQKQPAEVQRCRQKFLELDGADSRYAQFLDANSILAQADSPSSLQIRDAEAIIERVHDQYPEWAPGLLLRARLLDDEGRSDEAIAAYQEAIRYGSAGVLPYERLIDLLSRAGKNSEAESYVDGLRQQSFAPEGADTLEAVLLANSRGDREKALEIVRSQAEKHPKNTAIQLSLGQMLLASGHSVEALAAFEQAVEIAPDSIPVNRALALCLIEAKQLDRARQVLSKLDNRKDLPDVQKQLVLAEAEERLGDRKAAGEHYQSACNVPPSNPAVRLRMAEFLLRSPLKDDAEAGEKLLRSVVHDSPDFAPARRTLAEQLTMHGGEDNWKEARKLVHDLPDSPESSASNRRTDALLLIRRGGAENRQQALEILKALALRADADVNDRVLLAKLDDEEGHVEQARTQYAMIAAAKEPEQEQLVVYADFLLRHGPPTEADLQIRRSEKLSANDPRVLALRVRWLHAQDRDREIGPLVEAFAERGDKSAVTPEEKARNWGTVGSLYESCEQYRAAEGWYRRLLGVQPDRFEPLASVLAKQKRGGEAVSVCLDAAKHMPPFRPALVACVMRVANQITEKEFQAADSLLAAAGKDRSDPQFLESLAAVRIVEDRVDEAIAVYRRALEIQPQSINTLNNLASLLGEQAGRTQEALELINRAIDIHGPQPILRETKGEILLRGNRVEEALPLIQEAASSAAPDPRVLLHLADAYLRTGKFDEAGKAFKDAKQGNVSQKLLTPADRALIKDLGDKLAN